ncbi:MAG: hypothetical protein ABIS07_05930 [Dokdonella sp.]
MRALNVVLACLLLPTLASAEWKEAKDATWHPPQRLATELTTAPGVGDLALDPAFNTGLGFKRFDFNDANSKRDRGLRVVPVRCGVGCTRFLVFGTHPHGSTWDVVIAKIDSQGIPDSSFGIGGRMQVATPLLYVTDVAVDASATHFYVAGRKTTGAATDSDFAVTCIDASGGFCAGFGTLGTTTKWFDLDTNKEDRALHIRYLPAVGPDPARLLVSGIATGGTPAAPSDRVGVVAIDPVSGATQASFGSAGKVVLQVGEVSDLAHVELYDMALSASSMPGGARLYLAGSFQRAPLANNDMDGFIMAIDPDDGSLATSFHGGMVPIHLDMGPPGNPYDEVSGIEVLPDGKIAMVGRSIDANSKGQLLLARATALDGLDPGFCGGGVCAHVSQDPTAGIDAVSIRVRPTTHDLVVGLSETRSVDFVNYERLQVIQQFSASGITLHGRKEMDYVASGTEKPDATTAGLYVGSDAAGGYAMAVGSTTWSETANDYDITVVRMIASDELFASGFGNVGVE